MAMDYSGLFQTPESIRLKRLNALESQAAQQRMMGGSMAGLLGQVAAGRGAMMAEGIAGAFGLQTVEEKEAEQTQSIAKSINWDDPASIREGSKLLADAGLTQAALATASKADEKEQFNLAIDNARLTYDTNKLNFEESKRIVEAKPKLREILSTVDLNTKGGKDAAVRAAFKVSVQDGKDMLKYLQDQDKLALDRQRLIQGDHSKGLQDIVQDEEGNLFMQTSVFNNKTAETGLTLVPMVGSPDKPVGKISIAEQYGLTAEQDTAKKGGEQEAKKTADEKVQFIYQTAPKAIGAFTTALGTIDNLDNALAEIDALPEGVRKRAYAIMTGPLASSDPEGAMATLSTLVSPQAAEAITYLNQVTGETYVAAYQELKGAGQITEYEGKTAAAAKNRLINRKLLTPASMRKALEDYRSSLQGAIDKMEMKSAEWQGDEEVGKLMQQRQTMDQLGEIAKQLEILLQP